MCPNSGNVLLCQSASYACQDDGAGAQKCLPRDDSFLDSVDESTTMPWASCSLSNAKLPSKCLFDFQCNCMDYANVNCYCSPSDAWRTGRKKAENCTTSSGEVGVCDVGKYCRTKDHYQECAVAPYLPRSTSLYSDCTNDNDQLKIFILYSWLRHNDEPGEEAYVIAPSCCLYYLSNMQDNSYESEETAMCTRGARLRVTK
ncbi:unnamed protein product [Peronospora belbahrii]|uniref:Extracellular membrane protein CFEM domain-containing protein n=1 Tax=Peronospora belbahrii TaxID=622444 RepID=A0AAU9L0B5_9STRA|nr:unnamed protein product [Peronospora belbahrii]